jgi:dihydrofolate reductase
MTRIFVDITMSLDGFICGPDNDLERLHSWLFGAHTDRDKAVMDEYVQSLGAVIMGRGTFDDGVKQQSWEGWVDTPPFAVPVFVVSHSVPERLSKDNKDFVFVIDGIESALAQARATAGDKDVNIMGGANIVQQYIQNSLVDEIQIHIVPVLLAQGIRLFDHLGSQQIELQPTRVIESPYVTHLRYQVIKQP